MNKGQRAMAIAILYPEGMSGRGGDESTKLHKNYAVSRNYVSMARTVRKWAEAYVERVLHGFVSLNEAYQIAVKARPDPEEQARQAAREKAKLDELIEHAPDLADKARDWSDGMTVDEAYAI